MKNLHRTNLIGGSLVLAGALLMNTAPVQAQDYGNVPAYNYAPAGQLGNLVSRIALYPDPLLTQIFAATAFPDQIAAAAQGSGGPFDPSVEALRQYPDVLQMMASDLNWTQALGQALMQDQGAVMDTIQNLRREAQQYGYLQNSPQMQVVDNGGYIDIEPAGGYVYVPVYDPYVVFARPRAGFFVGGAIRFGRGFHWAGGDDRFNWRNHEVVVNRRVWTSPVRQFHEQPQRVFDQRRFENNPRNFTGADRAWNRSYPAQAAQPPVQRNFTQEQPHRDFARQPAPRDYAAPQQTPQPRSFTPAPRPADQRNFTAPRQPEQRSFAPQQRSSTPQERSFTPQQRSFTPQERSFTPQERSFTPQQRSFTPQQRSFTPQERTFTPQQRSFTPQERTFTPQPRNEDRHFQRSDEGHGRWR